MNINDTSIHIYTNNPGKVPPPWIALRSVWGLGPVGILVGASPGLGPLWRTLSQRLANFQLSRHCRPACILAESRPFEMGIPPSLRGNPIRLISFARIQALAHHHRIFLTCRTCLLVMRCLLASQGVPSASRARLFRFASSSVRAGRASDGTTDSQRSPPPGSS